MNQATRRGRAAWRVLALAFAAGLLASACGATPTPAPSTAPSAAANTSTAAPSAVVVTPAPATTASSVPATRAPNPTTPATTGVVQTTSLAQAFVRNFNPFTNNPLLPTRNGIYEPMMVYSFTKGEIVPWLADSFSWSDDLKSLTMKLRPGVTWNDGQPLTANDVKFTFEVFSKNPGLYGSAGKLMGENGTVASIDAVDDTTVRFNFKDVNTNALYDVIAQNIVPEHIWKDVTDIPKFTNDNPVATGPITQVTAFADTSYQVDKNPNYWQAGKPSINGVRYTTYASNDQQTIAMADGKIDWMGAFVQNVDQALIAKDPTNLHYWFPTASMTVMMQLNQKVKAFQDVNVRKAMSMALNRDQMNEVALSGYGKPSDVTGLSDGYAAWKPSDVPSLGNWTTYDPAGANALLDQAGYKRGADGIRVAPDGTRMSFDLTMVQGFSDWISAGQIMVDNWKEIGVEAKTKMIDPGAFFGSFPVGAFDIALWFGYTDPTPYGVYSNVMSKSSLVPQGQPAGANYARYDSPAADALLAQWAATSDLTKQKDLAQQLMKVFADEAPIIPLWSAIVLDEYSTKNFDGWPSADNPYALGMPQGDVNPTQLFIFNTLTAK